MTLRAPSKEGLVVPAAGRVVSGHCSASNPLLGLPQGQRTTLPEVIVF